ncbi:MAG: chemotaxis protein CheW [Nannocystaceae bacterium]|nr:chemotaxis protein CheW [bacterium]
MSEGRQRKSDATVLRRLSVGQSMARDGWDTADEVDDDVLKLAGFHVGIDVYGIDIMRIKEVIQARPYPVRPVPHAPDIVEGVIALRGVVIPVVDLRKRFGVARFEEDERVERLRKLIIVAVRGRIVGLRVDQIVGELRVPSGALRPAPSMLRPSGPGGPEFFSGVFRSEETMVFVVNLDALLDVRVQSLPEREDAAPPRVGSEEDAQA